VELRQLEYVVAVVDHGSFRAAADALGVAPPSLSQGIKALEVQLGVALFHRLPRGVRLSDAGEAVVPSARQALRAAAVVRDTAHDVAGLRAGHLDLVCLGTLAVDPAAELVGRFRRQNPEVVVRLALPETVADVADRLRHGSSEVGIAELLPEDDDLEVHELSRQDFVALLPADDVAPGEHRRTIRQLSRLPLVVTPPGTSTRRQLEQAFAAAGLTVEVAVETEHREAMVALVAAGAGVAVVPRPDPARVPAGTVACTISPAITRRIGLVHRRAPLSPAAQGFVALARTGLPARVHRPRARRTNPR